MGIGIIAGVFLRNSGKTVAYTEKAIIWSIYLLLFALGLSIGSNPLIMQSLASLGLTALIISVCAVVGSVLLAAIAWRFIFSKSSRK
jgi:uncharacterized transporter YbjL